MTLTQMKYFAAVCREKSVTRAAEKLHISQPSVTVAMQELEAETGLNLFVRQGKRIDVTPEGEFLLAKVSAILHSVEQLSNDIGELVHTKNHIRLALPLRHALPSGAAADRNQHHSAPRRCQRMSREQASYWPSTSRRNLAICVSGGSW